jgi:hypothetical protein
LKESITEILVIAFFVFGPLAVWLGPAILNEALTKNRRKRVGEQIANAFSKKPLTRKQIEILSTDNFLTPRDIQILLRNQYSEAIKSTGENRDSKIRYFQELYEEIEKDEPFDGLPSDVRFHLEKIKESLGKEKEFLIYPLSSHLQNFNSKTIRREKIMLGLAIIGILISVACLFPPRGSQAELNNAKPNRSLEILE